MQPAQCSTCEDKAAQVFWGHRCAQCSVKQPPWVRVLPGAGSHAFFFNLNFTLCYFSQGFPGGSTVKNLSARQETRVLSLGQEDPLEQGMATHASILTWRIPWTEEPGGLQSMGSQRVRHDWATNTIVYKSFLWMVQVLESPLALIKPRISLVINSFLNILLLLFVMLS